MSSNEAISLAIPLIFSRVSLLMSCGGVTENEKNSRNHSLKKLFQLTQSSITTVDTRIFNMLRDSQA